SRYCLSAVRRGLRRRTCRLDRSDVDLNLVTLHAQRVREQRIAHEMCDTLAAGAVEPPLVVHAGEGLPVEGGVVQRHVRMRTAPAIGLELTARRPDQEHALFAGLKDADAPFTHGTLGTNRGESHRGRLLKMNALPATRKLRT